MALNSSRSAWSLSRQCLHSTSATTTRLAGASSCSSSPPSLHVITATARPAANCRAFGIARHPTALREQDDPLNERVSDEDIEKSLPRWAATPAALARRYDFPLREAKNPLNAIWNVNEDPAKLDEFYNTFLGPHGSDMLNEELRWLAVTHKSFDFGRRGFNTRLAFFGRQILVLEVMNSIMARPVRVDKFMGDPWERPHFQSPALQNVDKLSVTRPTDFMSIKALAQVGIQTGVDQVMRWKPRMTGDLQRSGIDTVLTTTIFAIVGAVSLQHGGQVASRIARERVIERLAHHHNGSF